MWLIVNNKNLLIILTCYVFLRVYLIIHNLIVFINIINPIFWGIMLIYLMFELKKNYIRFNNKKRNLKNMFIISIIHIIIYLYLGLILGFSKSPYSHKLTSILENILTQIFPIIVIEITRCFIINRNKNNKRSLVFVTIILILSEVNYNVLLNLYGDKEQLFKYICEYIFPLISCSILCTYLSLIGSYSLSLVYRVFKEGVVILLPILPDVDWFIKGSVPIVSSVIVYILYKYIFNKEDDDAIKKKESLFSKFSYSVTVISAIALICFMVGMFKYEPIAILSNSMVPTFSRADVVIYKKLNEKQLQEIPNGSIIVYTMDNQNIAHRIINVIKENDVMYQTKGDGNNAPDMNFVKSNQIKGVYVFHIKYIGFPSVWLYEYFNSN